MKQKSMTSDDSLLLLAESYSKEGKVEKVFNLFLRRREERMFSFLLKSLCISKRYLEIEGYLDRYDSFSSSKVVIRSLLTNLFEEKQYQIMDNIFSKYGKKHFRYKFDGLYDWDVHG